MKIIFKLKSMAEKDVNTAKWGKNEDSLLKIKAVFFNIFIFSLSTFGWGQVKFVFILYRYLIHR